ncbi:hypothetical protein OMW55_10910 [Sphingomonas sp. BN140010]|uniref:Uncharacterized protein n=1 Tax=Sphingomonas arvum TaxID=2992113 RepID=A0ABT3JGW7_9SPHN|nr:hypothetical protein [Sphingomonas sp. BN140010]MCW3798312.1 hypothetical protein [Sphingomonas sp. BN140010]
MIRTVLALSVTLAASAATASTPEAWAQMNKRAARACVAESGLARPQLLAARLSYTDEVPVEVRLIRGNDRQGRMQRLVCVYDRRTGRAQVQPAPNWNAPTTRP